MDSNTNTNIKHIIDSSNWVNNNINHCGTLKFSQNTIFTQNKSKAIYGTHVLNGQFKFQIKFHTYDTKDFVGIQGKIKGSQRWIKGPLYYANNGQIFKNGKLIKQMSKQHQTGTVTILGDRNDGKIELKINGVSIVAFRFDQLTDVSIEWVPFISLFSNSSVSIIQSFTSVLLIPIEFALSFYDWDDDLLCEVAKIIKVLEYSAEHQ